MRPMLYLFLSVASFNVFAGNYATCLLDVMPGIQNDAAATAANRVCLEKFPSALRDIPKGSGRGLFSPESGAECAMKKGRDTRSQVAGQAIYIACMALFQKP